MYKNHLFRPLAQGASFAALFAILVGAPATAQIRFTDIASPANGITYHRTPSTTWALAENLRQQGLQRPISLATLIFDYPLKPGGAPGVALLDYDNDGDLDIYVTNGPGADNALYANQLKDSGTLTFIEVSGAAGAAAREQDSTGVCYGDLDNDGDSDLLVLGRGESVRLFENQGGSFQDITFVAGNQIGGHHYNSSSCAMGDVNGDGLLDVFIGNTFDWSTKTAIAAEPWALNEHNQLFLNAGGNKFTDVSATSGIRTSQRDISWSAVMFDYDKDGDLDIIVANDQGAMPTFRYGGINRGFVRTFKNDGTGKFTEVSRSTNMRSPGGYMGFAVADYNGDGNLDLYVSNVGDWIEPFLGLPYVVGDQTTRWFLANGDGSFRDPGVGALRASGWSWGTAPIDYDNDGDFDIASVGGLDVGPFVDRSNPGTILVNDGNANFTFSDALAKSGSQHPRRNGHALAVGDLNNDGFEDLVTVSDVNGAPDFPVFPYGFGYGAPFESMGGLVLDWFPADPLFNSFVWSGVPLLPGTLSVDINSGGNGNHSVQVRTVGTKGLVTGGRSNRDGIGATVRFQPAGGKPATQPILGGSSHSSQDSLLAHFGLGKARRGMVEVTWQGGVRNRLYHVRAGETVRFPEIPCDFAKSWASKAAYTACVSAALDEAVAANVINGEQRARFAQSASRAYDDAH